MPLRRFIFCFIFISSLLNGCSSGGDPETSKGNQTAQTSSRASSLATNISSNGESSSTLSSEVIASSQSASLVSSSSSSSFSSSSTSSSEASVSQSSSSSQNSIIVVSSSVAMSTASSEVSSSSNTNESSVASEATSSSSESASIDASSSSSSSTESSSSSFISSESSASLSSSSSSESSSSSSSSSASSDSSAISSELSSVSSTENSSSSSEAISSSSGISSAGESSSSEQSAVSSSVSSADFYTSAVEIPIVQGKCAVCHNSAGPSKNTNLIFNVGDDQATNNYAIFETFVENTENATSYLLNKAVGAQGHGGGEQITAASQEYANLQTFLNTLAGNASSSVASESFYKNVSIENNEQTLRRAALLFAGRTPTDNEISNAVDSEEALKNTIKQLLEGEGFHSFLIRAANDRLLTDAFIENRFLEVVEDITPYYPILADLRYQAYGSDQATIDEFEDWARKLRYGVTRAPLELIAYIVENDRPYTEILTADYTMVNPQTNVIYNSNLSFDSEDPTVFKVGYNRGQILMDENYNGEFVVNRGTNIFSHGEFVDYPHAGILNEPAFLNRYPSTDTNRNRARSRWTYYHFLDVDIEKSSTRTTDPEALADTNNPTMNNANCTVCHQLMDPIAGAYQNYGDEGRYRSSWGGFDALPSTYKSADDSPYQFGDTWYKDMRVPGFSGQEAPTQSNTLQWLAQQIVNDSRFARATVKFWWQAVMSEELINAPENSDDLNFEAQLQAYQAQSELINELASQFISGFDGGPAYNLKDLLVAMATSDWFRVNATQAALSETEENTLAPVGSGRLLTAEELEIKTEHLVGISWGEGEAAWRADNRWSNLSNRYRIYYGGIDSDGITERARSLNSLMTNVALAHATSVSCPAVVLDFNRTIDERKIFKYVDRYTTPQLQARQQVPVLVNTEDGEGLHLISQTLEVGSFRLRLSFDNPYWDSASETGTQLIIHQINVNDSEGNLLLSLNGESFASTENIEFSLNASGNPTGGRFWNESLGQFTGWRMWGGFVDIPLNISSADTYQIDVRASRRDLPEALVKMGISVLSTDSNVSPQGEQQLKQQLQFIHQQFLGEALELTDPELINSYELLLELRNERIARSFPRSAIAWEDENCEFPSGDWWEQSRSEDLADPENMQGAWADFLVYILTDYRYLHE